MAYIACLLYVAVIYIRPGEIIPGWIGFPFVEVTLAVSALAAVVSLVLEPRPFADLPNDLCFAGFSVAVILSNPATGWLGGGYVALVSILPLVVFYFAIRIAVRTARQLKWFVVVLVVLTLFQATNGIVQYHTGVGLGGSTALEQRVGEPSDDEEAVVVRIRGTGIFGDPNDLAMALVVVLPYLIGVVVAGDSRVFMRLLGLPALGAVAYALILTQSRGGFLGLGALGAAYTYRRFGGRAAVLVTIVAIVAVSLAGAGRVQDMDSEEASAQGRIQAWSAGLQMLKSHPVIGVGFGRFTEYNDLVAHNSFVHSLAELGLVGGYFFIGMFYWFMVGNRPPSGTTGAPQPWFELAIWASGIGVMVCAFFLSRQYSPVLYAPLAIGAVQTRVALDRGPGEPSHARPGWVSLLLVELGLVVAIYVGVRVFGVWSGGA